MKIQDILQHPDGTRFAWTSYSTKSNSINAVSWRNIQYGQLISGKWQNLWSTTHLPDSAGTTVEERINFAKTSVLQKAFGREYRIALLVDSRIYLVKPLQIIALDKDYDAVWDSLKQQELLNEQKRAIRTELLANERLRRSEIEKTMQSVAVSADQAMSKRFQEVLASIGIKLNDDLKITSDVEWDVDPHEMFDEDNQQIIYDPTAKIYRRARVSLDFQALQRLVYLISQDELVGK